MLKSNEIRVYDNFLPPEVFAELQGTLFGPDFSWFFNNSIVYSNEYETVADEKYNFQFVHTVYKNYVPYSDLWGLLTPLTKRINATAWVRVKCNLVTRTETPIVHDMHVDMEGDFQGITGVLYINDNDGKTVFADGRECQPKANRLVLFDPHLMHSGTSCTDQKVRVVINLNFFTTPGLQMDLTDEDKARIVVSTL